MKKKYLLSDIKAGMVFSADAFVEGDNIFSPAGVPVRARDIENLERWGVTFVFSEGELTAGGQASAQGKPGGKAGAAGGSGAGRAGHGGEGEGDGKGVGPEIAAPLGDAPGAIPFGDAKLSRSYAALVQGYHDFLEKLRQQDVSSDHPVDGLARDVIALVHGRESTVVSAILANIVSGYDQAKAAVNCAILSVVVGTHMKLPAYKLTHLALGSLLHDAGMLRVPAEIVGKKEKLTPEESQKIRAHPLLSYRVITKELHYPEDVGLIGLQHHERWDGEGYPRKTAGSEIDPLARIVSVTDAFEAMVSEKPYRNSMIGYAAMKSLLADNARRFDPDVLKAFLRSMGIYPIGSLVLLNNAAIARVVETHPDAPLRPRIKLIVDEFGQHRTDSQGEILDLLTERTLFIARAIDPKELAV